MALLSNIYVLAQCLKKQCDIRSSEKSDIHPKCIDEMYILKVPPKKVHLPQYSNDLQLSNGFILLLLQAHL